MSLLFLTLLVVFLFAALLAYETRIDGTQPRLGPAGLLSWLISGNWPAKVGAGLIIVGIGALLRYAVLNIDIPAQFKLGSGVILSAILGLAATVLKNRPNRRAIHLALTGASLGVAYLTAYSAYGIFKYLNDTNALALLALVAVAAGLFAVTSNAMSIAILAMIGAYIAPKFAIGTPGVSAVYGYYLAASSLSLIMIALRGWRPLIHLSFLFTLAGALFFGWSGKFYEPAHYAAMQPMLLALTAVHVAMPLLEHRHIRSIWLNRFDFGYFVLLPLVVTALALKIAPSLHYEGAISLAALSSIWAGAAIILFVRKRGEAPHHAVVAALLAIAAALCLANDVPWLLAGLGLSVAAMAVSPMLGWPRASQELACGAAALFGALHVVNAIVQPAPAQIFMNTLFAYRITASALMVAGGWLGVRRSIAFARILGVTGFGWMLLTILAELLRFHVDLFPQICYGIILGAIFLGVLLAGKMATHPVINGLLVFALIGCGWWAVRDTSSVITLAYLVLTPAALLGIAWSGRDTARNAHASLSDFSPTMAIGLLPFALLPWALAAAGISGIKPDFFALTIAMAGIAIAGLSARLWLRDSPRWNKRIQPLHVYFTAFSLLYALLFHIERGIWPVAFEILALAYLIAYVMRRSRESSPPGAWMGAMMVISTALVLQAMLLRAFGPAGVMNASDISKMHLPAVISLMWAIFGAGLAWWGTRIQSRLLWSAGAALLVVAAGKLVLFDFGTLEQLGNILAFIAAGVVFMGVAWFAPMPPKAQSTAPSKPQSEARSSTPHPSTPQQRETPPRQQHAQSPPDQPYQPASIGSDGEHPATTMQRGDRQRSATSSRYREEPQGINWLWFVLLGFAILIALSCVAWRKQTQRARALQEYRQQIEQSSSAAQQIAEFGTQTLPAPAPASAAPAFREHEFPDNQSRYKAQSATPPVVVTDACTRFIDQLPDDYVLYAGGGYKGKRAVSKKRYPAETGRFDIAVNAPGQNVVLALGAYEPSDWNIQWTPSTRIVGVLVSGYHLQSLSGLPHGIPVLNASYESRSPCGFFYLSRENADRTDATIRKIFGRSAQVYSLAMNGRIDFGALTSSSTSMSQIGSASIERYIDENGHVGYRQVNERR